MRVLVTGHRGYIGSVLTPALIERGHEVIGLDTGFFDECTLGAEPAGRCVRAEIHKDIREIAPGDLEGCQAVIHLAALSNDPIGNLNPAWTQAINYQASVELAALARQAGAERFLFSSSCIMYGDSMTEEEVSEEAEVNPRTAYALSKVQAERGIAELASWAFSPVFLRNGTVYGYSPRMRFDTVVNSLAGSALATGKVTIHSDGRPWRPVVHVEDVARAFVAALEAPRDRIHNQALNVGAPMVNHQILELAEMTAAVAPGCELECLAREDADQRTYRTSFAKIGRLLPEFSPRWHARNGIADLCGRLRGMGFGSKEFFDPRFTRLRWLRRLLDQKRLDGTLRWRWEMDRGGRRETVGASTP